MQNVTPDMLKTCITMEPHKYENLLKQLFGEELCIEFSMDGIWVGYDNEENNVCEEPEIYEKLAEYFGVNRITDIHIDDKSDNYLVWIAYKK